VLEENNVAGTLRNSKDFARRPRRCPWYKRPLWQGVFISSLWVLFVLLLSLPTLVPEFREFWKVVSTTQDPQKLVAAMSSAARGPAAERLNFALGLLEAMLRPLLGIAFVLIFLAARSGEADQETDA
jgi:hypothetical protein